MHYSARFALIAASIALGACSGNPSSNGTASSAQTNPNEGRVIPPMCPGPFLHECSDAQILSIMKVSDEGEILIANAVIDKLTSEGVRAYAQRLISDHSASLDDVKKTAKDLGLDFVDNARTKELRESAQLEASNLASKSGPELDESYVEHELLDHLQDLSMIDHVLVPSASGRPPIATLLVNDRPVIESHLMIADALEAKMVGTCGGGATSSTNDAGTTTGGGSDAACDDAGTPPPPPPPPPPPTTDAGTTTGGDACVEDSSTSGTGTGTTGTGR